MGYPTTHNSDDRPTLAVVESERYVRIELDELNGALERNRDIVHRLLDRLNPILRSQEMAQDPNAAIDTGRVSPIAAELHTFKEQINYLTNEIVDVMERMDI